MTVLKHMNRLKGLVLLGLAVFTFASCSKDDEKIKDDKNGNGGTEQSIGAEIKLILPSNEELILRKENITSPIWNMPIVEEDKNGIKELGFLVSSKKNNNTYTLTTKINIKGPGTYPLVSNMGALQEGIVIGVLEKFPDGSPDDVYTMERGTQGEFVVQSMSNGLLKGNMKGKVTLYSNRNSGEKIIVDTMNLNLKYILESDI